MNVHSDEQGWPTIPPIVQKHFVKYPERLLPPVELDALGKNEREMLKKPLVGPPPGLPPAAAWLGFTGPSNYRLFSPSRVATGICFPEVATRSRWNDWVDRGPTLEFVCALETAKKVAEHYGAEMIVLLADNELCRDAAILSKGVLDEAIRLTDSCIKWLNKAYPNATLVATSSKEIRGDVLQLLPEASLFPSGIVRPWGQLRRNFWNELDFLTNISLFAFVSKSASGDTLLLVDHDQYRAAMAAKKLIGDRLEIGSYWPLPGSEWSGFRNFELDASQSEQTRLHLHKRPLIAGMLDHLKSQATIPRRMHRSPNGKGWLYLDSSSQCLKEVSTTTLREIGIYLDPAQEMLFTKDSIIGEVENRIRRLRAKLG
jgi:hypothetical protein